jgi:hypothetical protein
MVVTFADAAPQPQQAQATWSNRFFNLVEHAAQNLTETVEQTWVISLVCSLFNLFCLIAFGYSAPKKQKQKMSLNEFLGDTGKVVTFIIYSHTLTWDCLALGSWADEMDSLPSAREFNVA